MDGDCGDCSWGRTPLDDAVHFEHASVAAFLERTVARAAAVQCGDDGSGGGSGGGGSEKSVDGREAAAAAAARRGTNPARLCRTLSLSTSERADPAELRRISTARANVEFTLGERSTQN